MPLKWYSSMKKKIGKIRIIFDIENWLWKSEIGTFWSLDLPTQFDVEVDEKFLNGI